MCGWVEANKWGEEQKVAQDTVFFFCCHMIDLIGYNLESNLSKAFEIPEFITVMKNKQVCITLLRYFVDLGELNIWCSDHNDFYLFFTVLVHAE